MKIVTDLKVLVMRKVPYSWAIWSLQLIMQFLNLLGARVLKDKLKGLDRNLVDKMMSEFLDKR